MRESACHHRVRVFALDMLYVVFCAVERTRDRCAHSACRVAVMAALCVREAYAWSLRDKGVSFICAPAFMALTAFASFFCCEGQMSWSKMSWSKMRSN